MKRHLSKGDKLRRASRICWLIGTGMTGYFVFSVVREQMDGMFIAIVVSIVAATGLQYVITLAESALFDGTLPAPWSIDWSKGGPLPWLWTGAIVCLFADVLLNLGGVAMFTMKVSEQTVASSVTGLGAEFIGVVRVLLTFAFAVLFAVGSELLDEFASYADTADSNRGRQGNQQNQQNQRQNQEQPTKTEQSGQQHSKEQIQEMLRNRTRK